MLPLTLLVCAAPRWAPFFGDVIVVKSAAPMRFLKNRMQRTRPFIDSPAKTLLDFAFKGKVSSDDIICRKRKITKEHQIILRFVHRAKADGLTTTRY